jgi:CBS domain-containing protein
MRNDFNKITAGEVMKSKFPRLSPDDKIGTAAELLLDRRFKALPVVSSGGGVVGIVTSYDVLRYEFKREYRTPILYKEVFDINRRAAM